MVNVIAAEVKLLKIKSVLWAIYWALAKVYKHQLQLFIDELNSIYQNIINIISNLTIKLINKWFTIISI